MTGGGGDALGPPAADVAAAAAACARQVLEREGIAMFLGLHDSRTGRAVAVADEAARAEGARLAELLDAYAAALAVRPGDPLREEDGTEGLPARPWHSSHWDPELDHDPDEAALVKVLVVLADQHLRARP